MNKPFRSMWMTRDRPPTWNRLSPQWVQSSLPVSFRPFDAWPGGSHSSAPAARPGDQEILTQLSVVRC